MMGDGIEYMAANLHKQISAPCGLVKVVLPHSAVLRCGSSTLTAAADGRRLVEARGWRQKEKMFFFEEGVLSKRTEKEIAFYTEVLKLLVFLLVTTLGGTLSLLFKMQYPVSIPLIFIGAWLSFSLILGIIWITLKIKRKLEELDE